MFRRNYKYSLTSKVVNYSTVKTIETFNYGNSILQRSIEKNILRTLVKTQIILVVHLKTGRTRKTAWKLVCKAITLILAIKKCAILHSINKILLNQTMMVICYFQVKKLAKMYLTILSKYFRKETENTTKALWNFLKVSGGSKLTMWCIAVSGA